MLRFSQVRKSIFITLLLASCCTSLFAQNPERNFFVSSNFHFGNILIPPGNKNLVKGHPMGLEINIYRPTSGKRNWERLYHRPDIGITFLCMDFANREQLGQGYSIYPFINFNLTHGTRFTLKFKVATSIGYVTKKFDPVTNPANLAIGSHFNGFVNLRLNSKLMITKNIFLESGFGLTHFSNGAMDLPNEGLNMVTANLGLAYHFTNCADGICTPDTVTCFKRPYYFVMYAAGGFCAIAPTIQTKYPAATFSFNVEHYNGRMCKWNAGFELQYNSSRLNSTKADTSIHNYKDVENIQAGIKVGYAFVVGKLSLPVEMGVYVYSKPNDGHFFHRIGVRYQLNDCLSLGVTLKTQWANADFFEFGMGFTIPSKEKCVKIQ